MNEIEFIDLIDCRFPYHDEEKWRALITQGKSISANASFMVLWEMCRKRSSVRVSRQKRLAMLDAWRKENDHPLSPVVLEVAKKLITKGYSELAIDRGLELMSEIQKYVNQYNALSIVYFACYDDEGRADAKYEEIVGSWKNASAKKKGKRQDKRDRLS